MISILVAWILIGLDWLIDLGGRYIHVLPTYQWLSCIAESGTSSMEPECHQVCSQSHDDCNTQSPLLDAAGGRLSTPWAHGAGHVEPHKAISPGLVYDISTEEYVAFVCSLGYDIKQVQAVVNRPNMTCSKRLGDPGRLNYPSFSVVFGKSRVVRYTRQLTNVGAAGSVYDVTAEAPKGVQISVKPKQLVFKNVGDRMRYIVTFVLQKGGTGDAFGSITWKKAENQVRSPVAFVWKRLVV